MDLVQLVRCAFGHHARDRASVVIGHRWHHGRCKGCGAAMIKRPDGWKLERKQVT